jgi:uncharacterized membrane protein YgdD (TMEM256/DUF423 family)
MTWNQWLAVAAINGLVSVAAGAFGAHGLKGRLDPDMLTIFETGARYQMYHALALLAVAWLVSRDVPSASLAGWCFLVGIVIFTGTLFGIPLTGIKKLGMITPIGGVSLMAGWAILAWAAIRSTTTQ